MTQVLHPSWTVCGNCERWAGPRTTTAWRDHVEVNDQNDRGECLGGGMNGNQVTTMQSCPEWKRWSVLQ